MTKLGAGCLKLGHNTLWTADLVVKVLHDKPDHDDETEPDGVVHVRLNVTIQTLLLV